MPILYLFDSYNFEKKTFEGYGWLQNAIYLFNIINDIIQQQQQQQQQYVVQREREHKNLKASRFSNK